MDKGRMFGVPGWNERSKKRLLHSHISITPCGEVPKGNDPHGRIIYDGYAYNHDISLNACLQNTAVRYISFIERVRKQKDP